LTQAATFEKQQKIEEVAKEKELNEAKREAGPLQRLIIRYDRACSATDRASRGLV